MTFRRVVLDTNVIISRLLAPRSVPATVVDRALAQSAVLASQDCLMELANVLGRSKFDPYITISERQDFLRLFNSVAERVEIIRVVKACRDPRDDKFLELAVNGNADVIVTGDADLLALNPFQKIPVITATSFLEFNKT